MDANQTNINPVPEVEPQMPSENAATSNEVQTQAEPSSPQTAEGNTKKLNLPKLPANLKMPKIKFKVNKKVIVGIVVGIVFLIFILILLSLIGKKNNSVGNIATHTIEPSITPTPTPVGESPYANDPDVLKIQSRLDEFDKKLNAIDLREDTLRIPTLNWDVNFGN